MHVQMKPNFRDIVIVPRKILIFITLWQIIINVVLDT